MNQEIELPYGHGSLKFAFDEGRFAIITTEPGREQPLSDLEIGAAFDSPIASATTRRNCRQR